MREECEGVPGGVCEGSLAVGVREGGDGRVATEIMSHREC